jgi:acylphosphatase
MQRAIHCLISGRVQGVCFRAATQGRANELGVAGWARNLADGRVEVFAAGPEEGIEALRDWLSEGPPAARVDRVEAEEADPEGVAGSFEVH